MSDMAPKRAFLLLAIAAMIGGCSESASSIEAAEGVAPPAGEQADRLMAEAEQAAANAAERSPPAAGAGAAAPPAAGASVPQPGAVPPLAPDAAGPAANSATRD